VLEPSITKPKRAARLLKGKARNVPAPLNSSESYSLDEDYVEFLKT
jgi:hypothetical protein